MQRMGSVPILCVNITIDTMLKLDANTDAKVNIDAQWNLPLILILKAHSHLTSAFAFSVDFCLLKAHLYESESDVASIGFIGNPV